MNDDLVDFEEAWKLFEQRHAEVPDGVYTALRGVFMSGGYAAVGVLSNRLAKLPGTVEPGDMVKALINTIEVAAAQLEVEANRDFKNKTYGQS